MKFKDTNLIIRIDSEKKEQLKKIALKAKTTISRIVDQELTKFIKKESKND